MSNGRITNLFQWETAQGSICIHAARPTNIKELACLNSIMRLMPVRGEEPPIEKYVRFKNDITQWYKEMADAGLTEEEQEILKSLLSKSCGICAEQEDLMLMVQHPGISGFSLSEANSARKIVSKKQLSKIPQLKERFYRDATE